MHLCVESGQRTRRLPLNLSHSPRAIARSVTSGLSLTHQVNLTVKGMGELEKDKHGID